VKLPGYDGATGWLSSPPLTVEELKGKVVLTDFWTYTCINWLRTLAWVRAWADRYRDDGLVVVGVHTPEFPFERDVDNIRAAVRELNVTYPVAIDSDYRVWRAFSNHYWPAVYVADAEGEIRHQQFGEGRYDECERVIQQLLRESGRDVGDDLVSVTPAGFEVQADWDNLESPETYLGSEQGRGYVSADGRLKLNQWTLGGDWTIEDGLSVSKAAGGRVAFRFHARDVNLVMGPRERGAAIPFRVSVDGEPPGDAHGLDADAAGNGTLTQQRTHQLIREPGSVEDRTVEIEFLAPGAEVYCFTFG
jgi:thiol-disulfide isomerase/thioredoxin